MGWLGIVALIPIEVAAICAVVFSIRRHLRDATYAALQSASFFPMLALLSPHSPLYAIIPEYWTDGILGACLLLYALTIVHMIVTSRATRRR
jgi:hypothetical protein